MRGGLTIETKNKISQTLKDRNNKLHNNEERICCVCGNTFQPLLTKSGRLSKSKTCSEECFKTLISDKSKKTQKFLIENGKHKGWQSRNIISYAELFWMNVLNNNNIQYIHNHKVDKYFLDFHVTINNVDIDLEIDGKQHYTISERSESDRKRDTCIKNRGFIIYRIPWNSINTEDGKKLMKQKIDNFLLFYKQFI